MKLKSKNAPFAYPLSPQGTGIEMFDCHAILHDCEKVNGSFLIDCSAILGFRNRLLPFIILVMELHNYTKPSD